VAVSFGASSVAGGLAWWVPVALSVLVFAGGSQIAAVGVVLGGGSPVAAVVAGAVLNTRLFPYGLAVADVVSGRNDAGSRDTGAADGADGDGGQGRVVTQDGGASTDGGHGGAARVVSQDGGASTDGEGGGPAERTARRWNRRAGRWLRQLAGTHLITDESVAFALRQSSAERRRSAFWTCGVTLFVAWNAAVLLGVLLGSTVRNTNAFGLDATFPAVMLALALPTLTSRSTRAAAGTGAVIAVALTPVLPAGLPLLAALAGLGARWTGWRTWRDRGGRGHPRHRDDPPGSPRDRPRRLRATSRSA
jgi:predicted branched-subunit amino acid permease